MWMEFAFQELWGQKANINTMMLISKIWHIICLFWQFSFVSRMLIGNSFWHILHYPFYKVTFNDCCGNFYGWHRWSRLWSYLQIQYGLSTCGRHLYQCILSSNIQRNFFYPMKMVPKYNVFINSIFLSLMF